MVLHSAMPAAELPVTASWPVGLTLLDVVTGFSNR